MAGRFEHVIMTRFNLATPGRESGLRNRPGWLAERFELFERYCLPSVAAQRERGFHWIVYFDAETPVAFRARIAADREKVPFLPYFTDLFGPEGWARSIRESFDFSPEFLLTTRLDNDDGLAFDYVERVQRAVREAGFAAGGYNVTNGFLRTATAAYRLAHRSNAFFSYLAPYGPEVVTAPSIAHMALDQHGPVTQLDGPGGWMQTVHGGNVSNKIRGLRVDPQALAGRFPVPLLEGLRPVGALRRSLENTLAGPLRGLRDRGLALRRRLRG